MKCTSCGCEIKPVVAVDIDGTLGNYHGHFLKFAEDYLDRSFSLSYDGSVEMHTWMGIPLEVYREVKLAYRQGGGKRMMPAMPGAVEMMNQLRGWGLEIWLTTTRPYLRLDSTDPDTRFWLQRYQIPYDHLLYHEDKYRVLKESVDPQRVIAVVDDLPEQLRWAEAWFGVRVPVQVATSYNRKLVAPNCVRMPLPDVAAKFIYPNLNEWRSKNAQ